MPTLLLLPSPGQCPTTATTCSSVCSSRPSPAGRTPWSSCRGSPTRSGSTSSPSRTTRTSRRSSTRGRCCPWSRRRRPRVRVAPNVANLPLRPPVVLARSVASLDILSGGRVELGLGAGAFWDAIAAMGGPRLTPRAERRRAARGDRRDPRDLDAGGAGAPLDGEHYRLDGAQAGPAPAHDVGIWLGAYKPRMLRAHRRARPTAGCRAGATPQPDELPAMNARIDEAAVEAGPAARGRSGGSQRQRQLRRRRRVPAGPAAATGPSSSPGSRSTTASSAFILAADAADDLRRFAERGRAGGARAGRAERALRAERGRRRPPGPVAADGSPTRERRLAVTADARPDGGGSAPSARGTSRTRPAAPPPDPASAATRAASRPPAGT